MKHAVRKTQECMLYVRERAAYEYHRSSVSQLCRQSLQVSDAEGRNRRYRHNPKKFPCPVSPRMYLKRLSLSQAGLEIGELRCYSFF